METYIPQAIKNESASQSNSMFALMNEDRSKSICLPKIEKHAGELTASKHRRRGTKSC